MADQAELSLPRTIFNERTAFTATVRFRTRATAAASIPTTSEYKLFNLTTWETVKDWTTLTPAAEIEFAISAQDNLLKSDVNTMERIEMLVTADRGLTTQVTESAYYKIKNVGGISP